MHPKVLKRDCDLGFVLGKTSQPLVDHRGGQLWGFEAWESAKFGGQYIGVIPSEVSGEMLWELKILDFFIFEIFFHFH